MCITVGQKLTCAETLSLVPPRGKSLEDMYKINWGLRFAIDEKTTFFDKSMRYPEPCDSLDHAHGH